MKQWHVSIARYNKTRNAVSYRRVRDFTTCDDGLRYLNSHSNRPVTLWHDKAATLENPYMAIVETNAYKLEEQKARD